MREMRHPGCASGVEGIDEVLRGGYPAGHPTLLQGGPGAGKTTLGLQFLFAGRQEGERVLFISLSQTREELELVARSHGWSLEGIEIAVIDTLESGELGAGQGVFQSLDLELARIGRGIQEAVARVQPSRLVIDSICVMRLLAGTRARYRAEMVRLKRFCSQHAITALLLDNDTLIEGESELGALMHAMVRIVRKTTRYGTVQRWFDVVKVRGVDASEGRHGMHLERGGARVYPRLSLQHAPAMGPATRCTSGVEALDALLGGGLSGGSTCMLLGPTGVGKSTVSALFLREAAAQGGAAAFLFAEGTETFLRRSRGVGIDLEPHLKAGRLALHHIDPILYPFDQLASFIRRTVEERRARVVLIDSLTGYLASVPDPRVLIKQLHDLLRYLGRSGVLTLLAVTQPGGFGDDAHPAIDASYLADTVVHLGFFLSGGRMRRCVSVIKKRMGEHAKTVCELLIEPGGVTLGAPLDRLQPGRMSASLFHDARASYHAGDGGPYGAHEGHDGHGGRDEHDGRAEHEGRAEHDGRAARGGARHLEADDERAFKPGS